MRIQQAQPFSSALKPNLHLLTHHPRNPEPARVPESYRFPLYRAEVPASPTQPVTLDSRRTAGAIISSFPTTLCSSGDPCFLTLNNRIPVHYSHCPFLHKRAGTFENTDKSLPGPGEFEQPGRSSKPAVSSPELVPHPNQVEKSSITPCSATAQWTGRGRSS